jgi:hypothetical protein
MKGGHNLVCSWVSKAMALLKLSSPVADWNQVGDQADCFRWAAGMLAGQPGDLGGKGEPDVPGNFCFWKREKARRSGPFQNAMLGGG